MKPSQLRALFRRHLVAALVVIVLAGRPGVGYQDHAADLRGGRHHRLHAAGGNPYSTLGSQLIPMTNLMTATITSTEYLGEIRAAGGTAAANIAMVNLYNEQFPQYGVPYVSISTESSDPAAVGRTFDIIVETLRNLLSSRQTQAGVPQWSRVSIRHRGRLRCPGSRRLAHSRAVRLGRTHLDGAVHGRGVP